MSVQTSYGFGFQKGVAGGLFDLSAHEVSTRQSEGEGVTFGVGVVVGKNKGTDVKLPTADSTADQHAGVVVHNSVMAELDMNNKLNICEKRTVGCLHHGKIWVETGKDSAPAYKEKVYLIVDGDEAGLFNTSGDSATKVELNAHYLGVTDTGIANAEFFAD